MGTRYEKAQYAQAFTEKYVAAATDITQEEARRLQSIPFSENPAEFFK